MLICQVVGSVVSTAKNPGFVGLKLMLVQRVDQAGKPGGEQFVAADTVGAGVGEMVLVATGGAARATDQTKNAPTDAAIVGIVDRVDTPASGKRPTRKEK
jgi:ethanolamine utilization protein EutN